MNDSGVVKLTDPTNIITYLCFFSPIILASGITSLSFIFQNFKGLIYLGFLIAICVLRNYVYMISGSAPSQNDGSVCTAVQYSQYGNPTFSAFVFSFTIVYLLYPMFSNGHANYWTMTLLLVYFMFDLFIKYSKRCINNLGELFLNVLSGASLSALIVTLMYVGGSGKYLFFNEVSSDVKQCYQPKKQTFKCSLYQNGELISSL